MNIGSFNVREFIDNIRWHRDRLGVEVDGRATRIVKVRRGHGGSWVMDGFAELDIDLMHASAMEKQRFKLAVKQIGKGLNSVAVNAEHASLRVRRMSFAKMPEGDLLEAIRWNFREHVEGGIEKYVVGYTPLDETKGEDKVPIMAYGLASEAIDEYLKALRSMGLKVVSLEPAASALLAAFHANKILDDGLRHVCVSFGDAMTLFSVMRGRSVLFCRPLPGINHDALARLIMRNLNLDADSARKALHQWMSGALEKGEERSDDNDALMRRLETTIGHFYSQLAIEMQRSIDAFCIMYSADKVDMIHICGMGSRYPGVIEHMSRNLGIETSVFNPFQMLMEQAAQTEEVKMVAPMYSVAVGLAMP